MGSNMIIVRKISNRVLVYSGKGMRSKLIITLSLAKKRSMYVYQKCHEGKFTFGGVTMVVAYLLMWKKAGHIKQGAEKKDHFATKISIVRTMIS